MDLHDNTHTAPNLLQAQVLPAKTRYESNESSAAALVATYRWESRCHMIRGSTSSWDGGTRESDQTDRQTAAVATVGYMYMTE